MSGRGIFLSFLAAGDLAFVWVFGPMAGDDEEHEAMMDWYVNCNPESFLATSGNFSNSWLMSNSGMLTTWWNILCEYLFLTVLSVSFGLRWSSVLSNTTIGAKSINLYPRKVVIIDFNNCFNSMKNQQTWEVFISCVPSLETIHS